ncbi:LysR family transcriptional regulator [Paraburkholderia sp. GAS199]|uniref:LysR family transcriptional regulator n=1 Tax=Paraburkholderia sp. GAS199 TaxID=3035126 RepID=UPI003D1A5939
MELKQLRYFEVVAREGSLSRAATLLGVSQSLLTRHIQSLEAEFGLPLLYRNGHGMSLTAGGKTFLASASDILMRTDSAVSQMQALRASPGGTVTIGIPPMLGEHLLVPLTRRFRTECPEVRLRLREAVSGYVLEWLMTGKLDLGVLYNVSSMNTIGVEPLLADEMLLIGPPDAQVLSPTAALAFSEAARLPWILPPRPHGLRSLAEDAANERGLSLNVVVEVDAMAGIFDLVAAGHGFSIAPFAAVEKRLANGTLKARRIHDPALSGVLSIAFSPKKEATLAMKALYRIVREETESLVRNGVWRAVE